jgi:hypothetical protein
MSKESNNYSVEESIISKKKQKIEETSSKDKDGKEVDKSLYCSECQQQPYFWVKYRNEIEMLMLDKMEELRDEYPDLNKRQSKARKAAYVWLKKIIWPSVQYWKELSQCLFYAVRRFMPAVEGNEYTGFKM